MTSAEDAPPVPAKRTTGGRFAKGASGNAAGKPRGARNKATVLAQSLLDGEAEEITRALIREAKAGQPIALKLCIERLIPLRRGAPVSINLPAIGRAEDVLAAMRMVVESLAEGHLTPEQAAELATVVDVGRKTIELVGHEARILNLEAIRGS